MVRVRLAALTLCTVCAALLFGIAFGGCGSRTGLIGAAPAGDAAGLPTDAGLGHPLPDGASEPDVIFDSPPDTSPALDVVAVGCPGSVASTPAGQLLWQTPVVSDGYLTGPLAADPAGDTYFVDDGSLWGGAVDGGSTVLSLDSCGNVRWKKPWGHFDNGSILTYALISNGRLIASNGDIEAFDLMSGDRLWTADMVAFASKAGIGDLTQSDALGPTAADVEGTVYVVVNTQVGQFVLSVDPGGNPALVARIASTQMGGLATDVIIDALGHLDVPMTVTNVDPGPGQVVSLSKSGQILSTSQVMSMGYQNHLMTTQTYLLSEDQGIVIDSVGGVLGQLGTMAQPAVVDMAGALYAITSASSAGETVSSWAADRTQRWTANLPGNGFYEYRGGPLLGTRNVFMLRQMLSGSSVTSSTAVVALDRGTGAQTAWSFSQESPGFMMLVPPGELVFAMGQSAVAIATGGENADTSIWPMPRGGNDMRGAAAGQ